jgi:PBP1b-binding outer membrane lipoprotein LpoB
MNFSKYLLSTLLLSIFLFVACDESEDIQRYEQEVLTTSNNPLTYTNLTSYPLVGPITSAVPTGDFDTPYRYRLLNSAST